MADSPTEGRGRKVYGTPGMRVIHPDMCSSESLAECSILAQLLFTRLIAKADDQGRLRGSARFVRGECFPLLDDVATGDVDAALHELVEVGSIIRYQSDGLELVQLAGWWSYQNPRRAYPSRLPAPDGWEEDRVFGTWEADARSRRDPPRDAATRRDPPRPAALPVVTGPVLSGPLVTGPAAEQEQSSTTRNGTSPTFDGDVYRLFGALTGRSATSGQKDLIDKYVKLAGGAGGASRRVVAECMEAVPEPGSRDWLSKVGDLVKERVRR